jgi:hypothetical protein
MEGERAGLTRSDLALIRQAANHDWGATDAIRYNVAEVIYSRVAEIAAKGLATRSESRWFLAAVQAIVATNGANLRLIGRVLQASTMDRREPSIHPGP